MSSLITKSKDVEKVNSFLDLLIILNKIYIDFQIKPNIKLATFFFYIICLYFNLSNISFIDLNIKKKNLLFLLKNTKDFNEAVILKRVKKIIYIPVLFIKNYLMEQYKLLISFLFINGLRLGKVCFMRYMLYYNLKGIDLLRVHNWNLILYPYGLNVTTYCNKLLLLDLAHLKDESYSYIYYIDNFYYYLYKIYNLKDTFLIKLVEDHPFLKTLIKFEYKLESSTNFLKRNE